MLKRRIAMMGGALLGIGCGGGGPLAPGQGGTGPMFDENVSALSAAVTVAAPHVMPTVQAAGAARASSVAVPAASPNGIDYHGGPVIRTPTVFYIWYGGWNNNDAPTILEDLARNIGGSPYFDINASYGDSTGQIANSVVFGGSTRPGWLPDIRRWATVVTALLKPGGRLFMREGHPMLWSLCTPRPDGLVVVEYPYFETGRGTTFVETKTYVEHEGELGSPRTIEFNHGLAEIISALIEAGLTLTALEEHRSAPWDFLAGATVIDERGEYELRDRPERLAATYTLRAAKR